MQPSSNDGMMDVATTVSEGLKSLPPVKPLHSAWPAISAQLDADAGQKDHGSARVWWFGGAGIAVGFAAALLVATQLMNKPNEVNVELASLMAYSQLLEIELSRVRPMATVYGGHQAAAVAELEDHIALVDLQLAGSLEDPDGAQQLWGQRVSLMKDLVSVHTAQVVNTRL